MRNLWTLLLIMGTLIICGGYNELEATATITPKPSLSYQCAGAVFWVDIQVGSSTNPVTDLFGISFKLQYTNTSIIDVSSVDITRGNLWGTDTLLFKMVDDPGGVVSIAHSRKSGSIGTSSEYGTIARIRVKLSDNAGSGSSTTFTINDIEARDSQGNLIPFVGGSNIVTVVVTPPQPMLSSPAPDLITTNRQPLFRWGTVSGCTYRLMVDDNPDFSSPEIDVLPRANQYIHTQSLIDGVYYWKVIAMNSYGVSGKWSDMRNFTVSNVVIKPHVSSPQQQDSEFWVDIDIGSSTSGVSDLFGLSFGLTYSDPDMLSLVSSDSIISGAFWGTTSLLFITNTETPGIVSIALSQKAGTGITGCGTVLRVKFKLSQEAPPGYMMNLGITQYKAYNSYGRAIPLIAQPATFTVQGTMQVWPGDTNSDGIVDEKDIYPIAYYWNTIGQQRQNASLEWKAQPTKAWNPIKATYADTNGNGVIDADDVMAVGLNWLKTHTVATGTLLAPSLISEIDYTSCIAAYRAMYRVLEQMPETEGINQIRDELCKAIDIGIRYDTHSTTELGQNYPNPFNPEAWIPFTLAEQSQAVIKIYNISGQLIRTLDLGVKDAGNYIAKDKSAYWDGRNEHGEEVASGVYFYQLHAGNFVDTKQMVVLK